MLIETITDIFVPLNNVDHIKRERYKGLDDVVTLVTKTGEQHGVYLTDLHQSTSDTVPAQSGWCVASLDVDATGNVRDQLRSLPIVAWRIRGTSVAPITMEYLNRHQYWLYEYKSRHFFHQNNYFGRPEDAVAYLKRLREMVIEAEKDLGIGCGSDESGAE